MVEYASDKKPPHPGRQDPRDRRVRPAFDAIVGQHELKQALLAVATDDALDGLLVRGEKGTAKSTAVRALADLLPDQRAVADCPYGCHPDEEALRCADCRERSDPPVETRPVPLVTLPLGATRDGVVGTLSVADALDGDHEFDPGLLARAHRGILYVDEVNLLDDHLVDVLLDAAAGGVNRVERDGVSVTHPAAFTLVGTMNPEEGDLRPQLRDRFALQATVTGCEDVDDRVAIIDRALGDDDATGRDRTGRSPGERLRDARDRVDDVALSREMRESVAVLCRDAGVDGHRGDIATARAARALAALDGRDEVRDGDVERAAHLALPHRLRTKPFEDAPDPEDVVDDHFEDEGGDGADSDEEARGDGDGTDEGAREDDGGAGSGDDEDLGDGGGDAEDCGGSAGERATPGPDADAAEGDGGEAGTAGAGNDDAADGGEDASGDGDRPQDEAAPRPSGASADGEEDADCEDGEGAEPDEQTDEEGTPLLPGQERACVGEAAAPDVGVPEAAAEGSTTDGSRTANSANAGGRGARVRTERARGGADVDAAASVRAAGARGSSSVESRDLRRSVRAAETGALVVFAVDASASMRPAMRAAKGTVLELLKDAYQHRDEVAFVAFAGEDAEVLLPPTDSVPLAARHLKALPTGDRTPLPAGLAAAGEVLDGADPAASAVVVVTDGRANVAEGSPVAATRAGARELAARDASVLVVDAGGGDAGPTVLDALVDAADATRVPLEALTASRVDATLADPGGE